MLGIAQLTPDTQVFMTSIQELPLPIQVVKIVAPRQPTQEYRQLLHEMVPTVVQHQDLVLEMVAPDLGVRLQGALQAVVVARQEELEAQTLDQVRAHLHRTVPSLKPRVLK